MAYFPDTREVSPVFAAWLTSDMKYSIWPRNATAQCVKNGVMPKSEKDFERNWGKYKVDVITCAGTWNNLYTICQQQVYISARLLVRVI